VCRARRRREEAMSKKLLFATDFDGTLHLYPHGVTKEVIEMIGEWRKAGNVFGIITGRNYANAMYLFEEYGYLCDFFMCMTGAYAVDKDGELLFEYKGDGSILPEFLQFLGTLSPRYLTFSDGDFNYNVDLEKPLDEDSEAVRIAREHSSFTQVNTAYFTEEEKDAATAKILERYGDKVCPQANGTCLDIPPYGVTKATAVKRMADVFGVAEDCIYTAGDNDNDVSMLEAFHGYSLPYGSDAARAAAKDILPNVEHMLRHAMALNKE